MRHHRRVIATRCHWVRQCAIVARVLPRWCKCLLLRQCVAFRVIPCTLHPYSAVALLVGPCVYTTCDAGTLYATCRDVHPSPLVPRSLQRNPQCAKHSESPNWTPSVPSKPTRSSLNPTSCGCSAARVGASGSTTRPPARVVPYTSSGGASRPVSCGPASLATSPTSSSVPGRSASRIESRGSQPSPSPARDGGRE